MALLPDRPLGVDTPGPLRALFLDMPLADTRPAPAPELELRWWMANNWSSPTRLSRGDRTVLLQVDEQADALQLAARLPWRRLWPDHPLLGRVESAIEVRLVQHWGGWTDRPIEAWHRLVGSTNFDRQLHPRDAVRLLLGEPGRPATLQLSGPRLALGDAVLRHQVRLAAAPGPDPAWALAVRLDVKLPLGRLADAGGSGRVDAGAGLAATLRLASWLTGHAQLSLRRIGGLPGALALQPRPWQPAAEVSLAARLAEGWTLLLEDRLLGALFARGWRLDGGPPEGSAVAGALRPHNQIAGGLRWRALTVWLAEDFTPGHSSTGAGWFYDSNAPDVVLGAALAW